MPYVYQVTGGQPMSPGVHVRSTINRTGPRLVFGSVVGWPDADGAGDSARISATNGSIPLGVFTKGQSCCLCVAVMQFGRDDRVERATLVHVSHAKFLNPPQAPKFSGMGGARGHAQAPQESPTRAALRLETAIAPEKLYGFVGASHTMSGSIGSAVDSLVALGVSRDQIWTYASPETIVGFGVSADGYFGEV